MGDIIKKNIGKNTVGDSDKMSVNLKTYNRSTHDLSYAWRNSQSPGTLVPFMCEVALPGDTHEISLNADVMTHPTVGPLFGSFKLQLDIYSVPIRLYNGWLHNNRLGIGLDMSKVKLPYIGLAISDKDNATDINQFTQINPSCLLSYLGLRGFGNVIGGDTTEVRRNAIPLLGYWDIFKNYYANKQEKLAYYIGGAASINAVVYRNVRFDPENINLELSVNSVITIETKETKIENIILTYSYPNDPNTHINAPINTFFENTAAPNGWSSKVKIALIVRKIYNAKSVALKTFELENIDEMRDNILHHVNTTPFNATGSRQPIIYSTYQTRDENGALYSARTQFGLALKTYSSDLFNNWIDTEWIDGEGGINEITAIDTSTGSFTMDVLIMQKKVYDMLNRIAVSGGTYQDWIETVYTNEYIQRAETPIYEGGMSQEIVFQEVISNSASQNEPLGTLAGRGVLAQKQKGGKIKIKTSEPSYIMGIVSITPRLDYSQGNRYDTLFETLNDLHKPALDGIGYQDLVTDQMVWSDTLIVPTTVGKPGNVILKATGKQPAWINYMTNYNRTYGNFALNTNEAFMVLNRNYSLNGAGAITDLTTYIDPAKYNYVFADTRIDAMNFWVQIGIKMNARRKMSAKVIPNL